MNLAYPFALLCLIALPVIAWVGRRICSNQTATLPVAQVLGVQRTTWRLAVRWLPAVLRLAAIALLVGALARPQASQGWKSTSTEGLAIEIVYDRSGSMKETIDGSEGGESKHDVAVRALTEFVEGNGKQLKGREGDMIGLIAFARYADTISPLARSHRPLVDAARRLVPIENRAEGGTAIGDALALAAARLKRAEEEVSRQKVEPGRKPDFQIKSKVIVLMTDGENNAGDISPYDAAKLAKEWGIRIYTIGIGAGERVVTVNTPLGRRRVAQGSEVDERLLKDLAAETGGSYFPAANPRSLEAAYAAIDRLEKSHIQTQDHSRKLELFVPLAIASLALVAVELLLSNTALRRIA